MRIAACNEWVDLSSDSDFVFLTGDLGFMALEPLKQAIGTRFINAGVAEQNMVSVAAGLALEGMNPWVYSIAPFCYARPFEQIRNDVCQHDLPVKFVGNGGGYGYGPMGSSHHALEDYGILLTLPNMRAYIPAFSDDLRSLVTILHGVDHPAYLRLGRCEKPKKQRIPEFSQWRKLLDGDRIPIVTVGSISGEYWNYCLNLPREQSPALWALGKLPLETITDIPDSLLHHVYERGICIVEEHCVQGSAGQQLATILVSQGIKVRQFLHFFATGYPSGRYGSQKFHRNDSGIAADVVIPKLINLDG